MANQTLVPGISLSTTGQATVDPALAETLFDLAIQLEELTNLPVDVEHVLAAIVLASRYGKINQSTPLVANDRVLQKLLADHVRIVFTKFDGKVGKDD